MALSEFEQKRIAKLCSDFGNKKVPAPLRDRIRIDFRIKGNEVMLYESRPNYLEQTSWYSAPIAKFEKIPSTESWQLYFADRNHKWHKYPHCPPNRDIGKLLAEVEKDPNGIFWG